MGSLFKISSDIIVNQRVLIEPLEAVWGESRARINGGRGKGDLWCPSHPSQPRLYFSAGKSLLGFDRVA